MKSELMDKLNIRLNGLKNSPLYEYRISNSYLPVPGEGSLNSKIFFVGEAPGRNEAKTGRPFCGSAGKVLDTLLSYVKIKRDDVFITSIVKDRPPENRNPTKEEIEIYGPFLDEQIEIIKPKIIAALGKFAMEYVMTKFGLQDKIEVISKMHGKIFQARTSYGPVKVVCLYHPCVAVYNSHKIGELKKGFKVLIKK